VIVAVVSDGAGTAQKAAIGATIVCIDVHRRTAAYLRSGGLLSRIDAECVAEWIDSIRDRIGVAAKAAGLTPRDYAATLVALLADSNRAVVLHVGDGPPRFANAKRNNGRSHLGLFTANMHRQPAS
jgi:serine/threonine protein phosphatase PrpC